MAELEYVVEAVEETPAPKPRIGRPPGSRNRTTVDGTRSVAADDASTEAPKRRRRRKTTTEGLLDPDDVTALITTIHNIPAAVFKLDELRIDDVQVEPYAPDIAKLMNTKLPEAARVVKESVPLIGLLTFLGLVEAPTIINTYNEVREKMQRKQQEQQTQAPASGYPSGSGASTPPTQTSSEGQPLSMIDRLGKI